MKFALVNSQRQEAQPGLVGLCPGCDQPMVAKCGEVYAHHWSHHGRRVCDPWWENETAWHRAWKELFPVHWQEIIHQAESGERHIADVKTHRGWALEFQHSYLKPDERRARDGFYGKLIWVVDATRRKRDSLQLINAWNHGEVVGANGVARRVFSANCKLIREWEDCTAPVFFDLGDAQSLCWLLGKAQQGFAYIGVFPRAVFVDVLRNEANTAADNFDSLLTDIKSMIAAFERQYQTRRR